MDFSPGQVGVTPKGFGLAPCGTGHSTTAGICRYLRIWGIFFWIATHLVRLPGLRALRAGCSRTPGRCPGARPRSCSCPFPTPWPPDTAPGCTTWTERGMGCAGPATRTGLVPTRAVPSWEWRPPEQGKAPGLGAAAPCSQLCSWLWPWPGLGSLRRQSQASGTARGIIQDTRGEGLCLPQGSTDVCGGSVGPSRVFH